MEVARWQREYTQSQFEAVKNQLNPHFLFNSLNALSSLVYIDADLAESFIEKLSRSYRYLLEQRDKATVPLEQELQFLDSFLFLTKQRFGKKLQVSVEKIAVANRQLPPHTLMIVMETILENNSMSNAKPLQVNISEEENYLRIVYSNQPKNETTAVNAQLTYLQGQFESLTGDSIDTTTNEQSIQLSIPLIKA
ncbi:MAG: histidine kinase [Chitinophagaceae bacterium]|nr:MAG: histidine kinase [Chitinophagaceae bacterium]